jgi:hypothetical protein
MMRKGKENMQKPWCFTLDPKTLILKSCKENRSLNTSKNETLFYSALPPFTVSVREHLRCRAYDVHTNARMHARTCARMYEPTHARTTVCTYACSFNAHLTPSPTLTTPQKHPTHVRILLHASKLDPNITKIIVILVSMLPLHVHILDLVVASPSQHSSL